MQFSHHSARRRLFSKRTAAAVVVPVLLVAGAYPVSQLAVAAPSASAPSAAGGGAIKLASSQNDVAAVELTKFSSAEKVRVFVATTGGNGAATVTPKADGTANVKVKLPAGYQGPLYAVVSAPSTHTISSNPDISGTIPVVQGDGVLKTNAAVPAEAKLGQLYKTHSAATKKFNDVYKTMQPKLASGDVDADVRQKARQFDENRSSVMVKHYQMQNEARLGMATTGTERTRLVAAQTVSLEELSPEIEELSTQVEQLAAEVNGTSSGSTVNGTSSGSAVSATPALAPATATPPTTKSPAVAGNRLFNPAIPGAQQLNTKITEYERIKGRATPVYARLEASPTKPVREMAAVYDARDRMAQYQSITAERNAVLQKQASKTPAELQALASDIATLDAKFTKMLVVAKDFEAKINAAAAVAKV